MKDRYNTAHEYEQELAEQAEREKHEAEQCEGMPFCLYCLDDFEEAQRQELDNQGYYDWNGRWTT